MLVYRVEHRTDCCGPYQEKLWWDENRRRSNLLLNLAWDLHIAHRHIPGFWEYGYRCGFKSLDLLYTWFAGYIGRLKKNDYLIRVYEAPEFKEHYDQIAFLWDKAIWLNDKELSNDYI